MYPYTLDIAVNGAGEFEKEEEESEIKYMVLNPRLFI